MKRSTATYLLLAAMAAGVRAEDSAAPPPLAPVRLSLDDAIARARASSARLTSLGAIGRAASEGVRLANAGRRPDLDLAASYSRNSNVPELILAFPGAAPRTIFPNLPNQWRAHVGASLPVYTGGRLQAQVAAASENERAAISDRAAFDNDLVAETHVAYVNVLLARESARVLGEAVASYEAHLKDARNRLDLGLSASNEVLAITAERERAQLLRVQAENAAAMAAANLLRLVDLPPSTPVDLDPAPLATASAPGEIDALVKRATSGRAELEALRARIRAMEATVRVSQSASRPQVGVQAGYDFANPNPRILPLTGTWNDTWSIGLAVNWKVLDGGKTAAASAQAEAQADALRSQLKDLEARIRLEVETRRLELDSALAGRAVAQRGIEAARDAVRVASDRYKEGVLSSSELLDAETRLLRAELDATQNDAQIQVALANLTRAVGR
ncbi:MAG: TolC family protein [Vicinamibacteria bacterium]|nr:TolC family protein [Vicinamibacteria bacterium]